MAAQTQQEYYEGDKGGYQYLTLDEVINRMLVESHDSESYLSGYPRHLFVMNAKTALKELTKEHFTNIKGLELSLGDDYVFKMPQDYVDYMRISVVAENNTLQPLDINTSLNISKTYLQDHDYNIIFDDEGNAIEADGNNLTNKPFKSYYFQEHSLGGQQQLDTSKLSKNGEFNVDKEEGVIYFGSNLAGKDIVLEYISDGVEWDRIHESEIKLHKYLDKALEDLIYYKCISRRRNVPANEKERALRASNTSKHKAKIKLANFDYQAIKRVWRQGSKWVKS